MNEKTKYIENMIKDVLNDNLASAQKQLALCVEETIKEKMKEVTQETKK
jgi:hypothetical protein